MLCAAYPKRLPADEISEASGYSATSSSFGNAITTLRKVGAAEGYEREGGVKAADVFFA